MALSPKSSCHHAPDGQTNAIYGHGQQMVTPGWTWWTLCQNLQLIPSHHPLLAWVHSIAIHQLLYPASNGWWMSHLSWFFQGEVPKAPSEFTTATNARYISIMFYPWFHMIPMNKRFFLIGKGIYSIIFPNALICFGVVLESQGEAFREAIYHQLPAWRCSSIVMTSSRPPQLKP